MAGEAFWGRVSLRNFEVQNNALESSIIIINYRIVINVYYNCN